MPTSTICLGLTGIITIVGIFVLGGTIAIELKGQRPLPAIAPWAALGAIPLLASLLFAWQLRRGQRTPDIATLVVAAVLFIGSIAAFPTLAMNEYKAPQIMASRYGWDRTDREIRVGTVGWMRHSTVFYARREVKRFYDLQAANEFLTLSWPSYLIVPSKAWETVSQSITAPHEILGRHFDFYARDEVLVIANPPGAREAREVMAKGAK